MSTNLQRAGPMTVAEFLAWDDGTDTRYELVDGAIVAMNPPVVPHGMMIGSLVIALHARLPEGCYPVTGGGTREDDDAHNYRVLDITVSCKFGEQRHWVESPRLTVEVIAPSTGRLDSSVKLQFYAGPDGRRGSPGALRPAPSDALAAGGRGGMDRARLRRRRRDPAPPDDRPDPARRALRAAGPRTLRCRLTSTNNSCSAWMASSFTNSC
ncbi:MAG: Uma2 family endonuclease [Geminicoccaceae bacterium]|nr:Uma2 family endonuclease [Geminicoccaceae bacterium]